MKYTFSTTHYGLSSNSMSQCDFNLKYCGFFVCKSLHFHIKYFLKQKCNKAHCLKCILILYLKRHNLTFSAAKTNLVYPRFSHYVFLLIFINYNCNKSKHFLGSRVKQKVPILVGKRKLSCFFYEELKS